MTQGMNFRIREPQKGPISEPATGLFLSHAFSLIELLVVIGVIMILVALLAPVITRVKGQGQDLGCLNNLKQWGLATHLYGLANDDYLPPEGVPNPSDTSINSGWYVELPREIGLPAYHDLPWRTNPAVDPGRSIWICPANSRRSNGKNLFHYCLNEHINGTGKNNHPVRLGSVTEPSTLVWLFDSKNLPAVGYWNFVHTNLHQTGAQFLFLDGHVQRWPNREYWLWPENRARTNNPVIRWIP
jgi:prepilin-type processing-associated H-X9-DG protein